MREQLDAYVRFTFDLPAELTLEAQKKIIKDQIECPKDAYNLQILRVDREYDIYSNPIRDAFDQSIRVGDEVWWNGMIVPVVKVHEDSGRISVQRQDWYRVSVVEAKRTVRRP